MTQYLEPPKSNHLGCDKNVQKVDPVRTVIAYNRPQLSSYSYHNGMRSGFFRMHISQFFCKDMRPNACLYYEYTSLLKH